MPRKATGFICILNQPSFQVGDMPPQGYLEWHEWAKVQHKGGLMQLRCPVTDKFEYPQEHKPHA